MKIKRLYEYREISTGVDDLTELFLDTILDVSKNSVARRLQVGCIFVKNNNIVAKNIPGPTGPDIFSKSGIPCKQIR